MNMPVSSFNTTQVSFTVGNFSTNFQGPSEATSSVPTEVQKRFDAAQARLASAYAMPEGGLFNMLSHARQDEIQNARNVVADLKQDFPGVASQSNNRAVPAEARTAYETQQVRLADADAMPVFSSPFGGLFDGLRNEARQRAKDAMAGLEKDFPGLSKQANANTAANGKSSKTADVAAPQVVASVAEVASVNNSKTAPTTTGKLIDAATAEQAKSASGALGAYMHSNNIDTVDVNKLYAIANNATGQVPVDVQKAAEFMIKNPNVYKAIETSDVPGADGISARANFDKAAQGMVAFDQPAAGTATATAASKLSLAQQGKNASGTLAAYMRTDNISAVDMNKVYAIANNSNCKTSKDVRDAAAFMLKNPDMYRTIETNDVAGVDGISGLGNFENMAMGKIKFDESSRSTPLVQQMTQKDKYSFFIPVVAPKLTFDQQAAAAAGTLAAYARTNNKELVDPNMLYSLTANADKKMTKEVQQAAWFLLTHPDTFKRIETSQWSVVDGRASTADLNRAAQGMTKFA